MDEEYDIIVLGTGIKECILSALFQKESMKVLNIDRNKYYGGECASLNLETLYQKFRPENPTPPKELGDSRYWSVDLCPKFLMFSGNLVKILRSTGVTRYLEFMLIKGSYVVNEKKLHKVPATATEALATSLLGFFEKRRFKNFLQWVNDYDETKPSTWEGIDARKVTTRAVFESRSLGPAAVHFTGHCIALQPNDKYLDEPALDTLKKIKLYADSLSRYGSSPFVYPQFGIGGIPEGFSRLCAVNGGLQMLEKDIQEVVFGDDGKVCGIKVEDTVIKTSRVLLEGALAKKLLPQIKLSELQVKRSICILRTPVAKAGVRGQPSSQPSQQIIIPASECNSQDDIYIAIVTSDESVSLDGYSIAVVSTIVRQGENGDAKVKCAYPFLPAIVDTFSWNTTYYQCDNQSLAEQGVYVTNSMDASSHLEVATEEVLALYKTVLGKELDFTTMTYEDDEM